MYNFIDVNEASVGTVLPSEALKINGSYIEELISGYRTLHVSGREALSPDVMSQSTGIRDGSIMKGKRYPERIITVTYQINAESNEAFREAYNKLGGILDVKDAELIFNDEPDKFYIGTPCIIGGVDPGRNAVIGNFEILCVDPFKYSVIEYEATPELDEGSILIDYNGTYKAYPTLEAEFFNESEASEDGETVIGLTGYADCGYVAFFTEDEKIIQLGDPDEADTESAYPKSQTLVNNTFKSASSWGSAAKSQWKVNSGITSSTAVVQAGTPAMAVASYASTTPANTSGTLLTATSKANAPIIHYKLTAKATNRTANSVKVAVSVTTSLDKDASYFGRGYGLTGNLYIGGSWRTFTIKSTDAYWNGKSGHTVTVTYTISGLDSSTTALSGIKFKVTRIDSLGTAGILDETVCNDLKISAYATSTPASYYLAASSWGSGDNWHGPSITRELPADASGAVGSTSFTLSYSHKMSIGTASGSIHELGAMQVLLVSGSGSSRKIVAGVNVYKGYSGKTAKLRFYINGSVATTIDVDISHGNKYFNSSKTSTITKLGNTVTFNIGGIKKTFKNSDITDLAVNEVTFTFSKFGSKTPLSYNGLYWVKFVKNNCTTYKDIPNKFSSADVVTADCKNGEIYLNGVATPALGALGNDWEEFVLTPGLNQIGTAFSDWVADGFEPTFKVRYREVFL